MPPARAAHLLYTPDIGVGREIAIRELVELIAQVTGFTGEIRWDASKPEGQPRRMLDTQRAEREIGFHASPTFEDGLRATVEWFREHMAAAETAKAG